MRWALGNMSRRHIYRISIDDETRLERIRELRLSRGSITLIAFVAAVILITLAFLIVALTPLRKIMPGYMKEADRDATIENVLRLDSIRKAYQRDRAFLDNLTKVLDTERQPADSAELTANQSPLTADSLLKTSDEELKFREALEKRERYNMSVLAPLAAEGMMFAPLADGATISRKSVDATDAEFIIPKGNPISSIADGTVIDSHYSPADKGFSITIQHARGFITQYGFLSSPLVETGDHVDSGQIISLPQSGNNIISLRIWRDGDPLIPSRLLPK